MPKQASADTAVARSSDRLTPLIVESARAATPADVSDLVTLCEMAREEMAPKRGGEVLSRLDPWAAGIRGHLDWCLAADQIVVVTGCIDDTPVGYGIMRVSPAPDGNMHAVVEELFVDVDARSVSVGETMMGFLCDEALGRGALGIESLALPGDRATKNFFEVQGMVARAIVVHRWLDGR